MNNMLWLSAGLFLIALFTSKHRTYTSRTASIGAVVIFLYMVLSACYIVSNYFTGEGINDAVIFHLRYGLDGSGFADYYLIIAVGIGLLISSLMISVFYYRMLKNSVLSEHQKLKRLISTVSLILALIIHPTVRFLGESALSVLGVENPLSLKYNFSDYYKTASLSAISENHPNLVYIFAESFEDTYFDEKIFPSLVTALRPIREQSISFTQIKQAWGTSWTIAGMTSVMCGLPLVTPSRNSDSPQGNSMSKMSTFYSGAVCMSDMLHKEGYKLIYRSGSPLEFAGVDKLYKTHQFDDIKGIKELKPLLSNPSYQTPWGLYDDTLFDIAMNDFKKYSKSKQKFAMFLSTMDTHHPYGHVSKSCKAQEYKDGSNSMLNAVICSDELIAKFIKQIQDSPYGKNTIIVVGSDHLAMHNMAIDDLMKGERRDQFMIIDPRLSHGDKIEKVGSTLDIGATLLSFLGYKGTVGLSRDLLGDEPSLMEEFKDVDKLLNAWSNEISRFWEFPKIEKELVLDTTKNSLKIGSTLYKFPILLHLSENLEVSPFFEVKLKFFETVKLFGYLHDYHAEDAFLWVDKCSRINTLSSENNVSLKGKYCFALGKLGGEITTEALNSEKKLSLELLNQTLTLPSEEEKAIQRRENLMQIKEK
ncbi:phosphoglycerol transferase I [Sulfurospirillum diekertiae]|uniref:Phosphoglycerol transferase I n=1 Tax=Sulfurospirillum diekertiae TaxID=1854492 RepID=A0A290HEW5_9BACT|nr:sulfatase-like hydrolase/transferase [Sulfurospirillum diekertiae]ATB69977.1 phosphoglycerol transferase I [Sulfurospirillum diekertiae]